MSKVSKILRAAATGPGPLFGAVSGYITLGAWLGFSDAFHAASYWRDGASFSALSDDEQRMFLLFVAEAEE